MNKQVAANSHGGGALRCYGFNDLCREIWAFSEKQSPHRHANKIELVH
jgi:hypothetical protein